MKIVTNFLPLTKEVLIKGGSKNGRTAKQNGIYQFMAFILFKPKCILLF